MLCSNIHKCDHHQIIQTSVNSSTALQWTKTSYFHENYRVKKLFATCNKRCVESISLRCFSEELFLYITSGRRYRRIFRELNTLLQLHSIGSNRGDKCHRGFWKRREETAGYTKIHETLLDSVKVDSH